MPILEYQKQQWKLEVKHCSIHASRQLELACGQCYHVFCTDCLSTEGVCPQASGLYCGVIMYIFKPEVHVEKLVNAYCLNRELLALWKHSSTREDNSKFKIFAFELGIYILAN